MSRQIKVTVSQGAVAIKMVAMASATAIFFPDNRRFDMDQY